MSTDLPSRDDLRHVAQRLRANDIPWFRDRFRLGSFDWLQTLTSPQVFEHLGARANAGDLEPLRGVLGGLDHPDVGDVFSSSAIEQHLESRSNRNTLAAAAAAHLAAGSVATSDTGLGGTVGLDDDDAGRATALTAAAPGSTRGTARAGSVVGTIIEDEPRRRGAWWLLLLPLVLIGGLATWAGIERWGDDDGDAIVTADVPRTVVDTTLASGQFTTLNAALTSAGLTETLRGAGPFTVFAPTDAAFAKLPAGLLDVLVRPANNAQLTAILTHHVVGQNLPAAKLVAGQLTTVEGSPLDITIAGGVRAGGAQVTEADLPAANGVVHAIDTVLVPASVDLDALIAQITGAPTTTALTATSAPETTVPATPAPVTTAPATSAPAETATVETAAAPAVPASGVLEVAAASGDFTSLTAAITAAGLTDTLAGEGPFTVFAPNDDAFAKIPKDQLDALLADPERLSKVLGYHVVPGRLGAADLEAGTLTALSGETLEIGRSGDTVTVNGVSVLAADVEAGNGVIHVIDDVLRPASVVNEAGDFVAEDQTIYFDSGSAAIRGDQQTKLDALVARMKDLDDGATVSLVGFTDSQGDKAANLALSERRVASVVAALNRGLGSDAGRFSVNRAALGDARQQATLALSRRVTISLTPR